MAERSDIHKSSILTNSQKVRNSVMPAKAGIQNYLKTLDSRLRGNDANGRFKTFYETINVRRSMFDVLICSLFRPGGVSYEHRRWPQKRPV